ncbi:hypothetical protein SAMN00120144_3061 [Hymenobacter roseosalivarius DSM 11622]|uniref:DUF4304 domain-containing protein n=1 Tax=Hymenobacter roseosalivarius DSM 11622 TaxID=645990 RepID=A0A1W1W5L2_9BACT|nr:hypothetical protein [Hymenobacter roseosalivarius]SMC00681.1 hypothetical protein SAMN00120144_3061 [Hymenobacter roseosalivarius DSM 11622]
MKSKDVKTLVVKGLSKYLDTSLSTWKLKNHLFYGPVDNGILQGIYFNSSGFSSNRFEIVAFIQPLYVPSDTIDLSFSLNLKTQNKKQWWEFNEDSLEVTANEIALQINANAKAFLTSHQKPVNVYKSFYQNRKSSYRHFEMVAYSAVYAELQTATNELKELLSFIKNKEDLHNEWVSQVYNNTIELLYSDNPKALLSQWEYKTLKALKIT